ncbi:MAG: cupin domain-containing protein [Rickettsiaceae bacterium]|nr:cupin domain-containing protein [Rickettsiaceae bacterium]
MNKDKIKKDWANRGYSFGVFKDPPGRVWQDFTHASDELFIVVKGRVEMILDGKSSIPKIGEEIFIPRGCLHTVKNIGTTESEWFYGYN